VSGALCIGGVDILVTSWLPPRLPLLVEILKLPRYSLASINGLANLSQASHFNSKLKNDVKYTIMRNKMFANAAMRFMGVSYSLHFLYKMIYVTS